MKKKKVLVGILISLGIILLGVVLFFVCAFFGNPVSYYLSKESADDYIAENYAGQDFVIEDVGYDFKRTGYYAKVRKPGSKDIHFNIYFDLLGRPCYDSYENIEDGWNTYMRLESEYRNLVKETETDVAEVFTSDIFFGEIKTRDEVNDYVWKEPYGIVTNNLIVDHEYDMNDFSAEYGHIVFYYDETELTAEKAAERLLQFKAIMDKHNIKFYAIDFIAQEPKTETNAGNREEFSVREFRCSDIYEEGLADRLQEASDSLAAYYSSEDEKK